VRVGVVVFPGTNCEQDVAHVYGKLLGCEIVPIWHRDRHLHSAELVVLPGGFSYGDYLRTGALAKISPVMDSVRSFAEQGGKVLGICNGFQILCESGLLPGALLENVGRRFLSRFVHISVQPNRSFFTKEMAHGARITCPIAHFQGNYYADPATLAELESNKQVVFRYCSQDGTVSSEDRAINVNGSMNSIAGICNKAGNVVGLMPHPERAVERLIGSIGSDSGLALFSGQTP
jgi:phosphoribosylformylglycinamidine synthase I